MWWLIFFVPLIFFAIFPRKLYSLRFLRLYHKIPGPPTIPYIGSMFFLFIKTDDLVPAMVNLFKDNYPIVRFQILDNYIVGISDPNDIEKVLGSKTYITKSFDYKRMEPWLGQGLLTSTGERWFKSRKALTPAFHFGIIEQYFEIFNSNGQILSNIFGSYEGRPVPINHIVGLCTLDIICETAMGVKVNAQLGEEKDYVNSVLEVSTLIQVRQINPHLYYDFNFSLSMTGRRQKKVLEKLHGFTNKVIKERTEAFLEAREKGITPNPDSAYGAKRKQSFLDILIEISVINGGLTQEQIREEVDTFMFEGHDTTSAALSWALFEIGHHPHVQKLVQKELDAILGDTEREITSADVANMKYLERVIKEALRLHPSVPAFARHVTEDVVLSGYTVPAGANIGVISLALHYDPRLYPEPEKFDPDRFLSERIAKRHPYSYLPFSAGPRNCIGQKFAMMEEKVVLAQILRKYDIKTITKPEDIILMAELILRPKEDFQITFTPRKTVPK